MLDHQMADPCLNRLGEASGVGIGESSASDISEYSEVPSNLNSGAAPRSSHEALNGNDEEEDVCRICRTSGEDGNPLYYPCACSGSIKYVHQDCLLQWLNHSNKKHCEVCKHPFAFSPVYAEDAPAQLPLQELLLGAALKAGRGVRFVLRLAMVLSVWLLFIPFSTCWLWRLTFVRSFTDAQSLIATRGSPLLVLTDCVYGSFLSAGIVLVFLGVTSLREYFRHVNEHGDDNGDQDEEGAERVRGRRPPQRARLAQGGGPRGQVAALPGPDEAQLGEHGGAVAEEGAPEQDEVAGEVAPGADAVAAPVNPNGGFELPEELDGMDDMPFDELVGMQGPILHLLENAITVMASNAIFLALVLLLPFTLGRMALSTTAYLAATPTGVTAVTASLKAGDALTTFLGVPGGEAALEMHRLAGNATVETVALVDHWRYGEGVCLGPTACNGEVGAFGTGDSLALNASSSEHSVAQGLAGEAALSHGNATLMLHRGRLLEEFQSQGFGKGSLQNSGVQNGAPQPLPNGLEGPYGSAVNTVIQSLGHFSDTATVAVGYGVMLALFLGYVGGVLLTRYVKKEPLLGRPRGGAAALADAAPSLVRQVSAGVRYLAMLFKVSMLLLVELGVFPLLCGWWLDVCTMGLLKATLAQRAAFLRAAPVACSLLHWLVGIVYMLQVSIFISLLREVLRPGVLSFLRDPADPNYNPFRDLVDDPLPKHARRVVLSLLVYANLVVMLVYVPVRTALALTPAMFPLNLRFSDPFTEIPADMLLFHVCLPFTVEHFRPKAAVKRVLTHWLNIFGRALGLAELLLPQPDHGNEGGRGLRAARAAAGERLLLEAPPPPPPGAYLEALHGGEEAEGSERAQPKRPGAREEWENDEEGEGNQEDTSLPARMTLLVLAAWGTMLLCNTAVMVLPVAIGRAVFGYISRLPFTHGAQCNDMYAFGIGCYALWGSVAGLRYLGRYLQTHNARVLFFHVLKWAGIILKSAALLALWIGVVPVLIGLLFELLMVVPLRVPIDESPVFLLYQDWALGLLFLKIWTRLVMMGQANFIADESWRAKLERVKNDGFARLNGFWVFREIVAPVLVDLLTALCVPFVITKGIVPLFGFPLVVNSAIYRFAWLACLLLIFTFQGLKRTHNWLTDLHNSIRDDRYLVGRRLHNFPGSCQKSNSCTQNTQTVH